MEAAQLLRLVCKIFYSACYMGVPALLLQPEHFQGWMGNLHALILRPAPPVRHALPAQCDCDCGPAIFGLLLQKRIGLVNRGNNVLR